MSASPRGEEARITNPAFVVEVCASAAFPDVGLTGHTRCVGVISGNACNGPSTAAANVETAPKSGAEKWSLKMKRSMIAMVSMVAVLFIAGAANATSTTITFDPTEMVAPATTNLGASAAGDGRVYDYGVSPVLDYRTYVDAGQTAGFNAWVSSLGVGQGISKFNLNLSGGAPGWGQTLVITDWTKPITAAGPAGWTATVTPDTFCIAYETTDPALYIRPGNNAGAFEFTAETNGVLGGNYILWVGAGIEGIHATGSSPTIIFQRDITAQASAPVPEPITMVSAFLVVSGLGAYMRRRTRAARA
jgi:hypothetical protein